MISVVAVLVSVQLLLSMSVIRLECECTVLYLYVYVCTCNASGHFTIIGVQTLVRQPCLTQYRWLRRLSGMDCPVAGCLSQDAAGRALHKRVSNGQIARRSVCSYTSYAT